MDNRPKTVSGTRLVRQAADGYFVFYDPKSPGFEYDFKPTPSVPAIHWVAHMADKTWVTKEHLGEFAALIRQADFER